ncbi:unknown [Sutterella wadsworthensis CAG:135]|nr:unknown [Sutterella wadsworthensis CAG:135]
MQFLVERFKRRLHEGAVLDDLFQEFRCRNMLQNRIADRAGQCISAKGRSVRAGFEMLGNSVVGQYAADRNAAGQTFRRRYDIGANADLFIGEERARTCAS